MVPLAYIGLCGGSLEEWWLILNFHSIFKQLSPRMTRHWDHRIWHSSPFRAFGYMNERHTPQTVEFLRLYHTDVQRRRSQETKLRWRLEWRIGLTSCLIQKTPSCLRKSSAELRLHASWQRRRLSCSTTGNFLPNLPPFLDPCDCNYRLLLHHLVRYCSTQIACANRAFKSGPLNLRWKS